jgi:PIF1-like helicase
LISSSLNQQPIFQHFEVFALEENMRVNRGEVEFCNWLKQLGDGLLPRYEGLSRNLIRLPPDLCLQDRIVDNFEKAAEDQDLIDFVFERPFNKRASYESNRAILAPLNEDTFRINDSILNQIDGNFT